MEVKTTAKIFDDIYRPVSVLAENCVSNFHEGGIYTPGISRSGSASVEIDISEEAFTSYIGYGEKMGLRLGRLLDILDMADSSDQVKFALDVERQMVDFRISNKEFQLGMVDIDSIPSKPEIPEVEYPVLFNIEGSHLKDAINTADLLSNEVTFDVEDGSSQILVRAEEDVDKTTIELTDGQEIDLLRSGHIENSFSLDILSDVVSSIDGDTNVHLKIAHDRPIVIRYDVADGDGEITYNIAPYKTGR